MAKTIVLTGGGTAGHITTNLNLIPLLAPHFDRIVYIGSESGPERELIKKFNNVEYYPITSVKLRRSLNPSNLSIPFKLYRAVREAKAILEKIKPDVIFSKGGYVSLPIALASKGIPLIIHESDYSLGLANKIASRYADTVATTFEDTAKKLKKGLYIGPPIPKYTPTPAEKQYVRQKYGSNILLIMGGSLGARSINEAVFEALEELAENYQIVHIVGKGKGNDLRHKNYTQIEYVDNLPAILSVTSLAITRGGSNALFELLANEIPMLIIPLEKGSRGDQVENAKFFEKKGYAITLADHDLNSASLLKSLQILSKNATIMRACMHNALPRDALDKLVSLILKSCRAKN